MLLSVIRTLMGCHNRRMVYRTPTRSTFGFCSAFQNYDIPRSSDDTALGSSVSALLPSS